MYIRQKPTRVVFLPEARAEVFAVQLRDSLSSGGTEVLVEPSSGVIALETDAEGAHGTGWEPVLDWLYAKLACSCVEMRVVEGGQLWFDSNGKQARRPVNPVATLLHGVPDDPIVGHALFVLDPEQHPDLAEVDELLEYVRMHADDVFFSRPKGV